MPLRAVAPTTALAIIVAAASLSGCAPSSPPAVSADEVRLSGTVLYRERMALPPDAIIEVRLEDVSLADAPADVLAKQTIAANGRQVPIPFEVTYSPARVEPNRRYAWRAAIRTAGGELMFATTTHHAALEAGAPTENIAILVQRTGGGTGQSVVQPLPTGPWQLSAIERPGTAEEAIAVDPAYTIEFFVDGRFSGRAHCNRYTGGYEQPESGRLSIAPAMAATLAACPPPSIADEFLRAVGAVTRYEMRGGQLRLSYGADGVLIFERSAPTAAAAPEVGRTFVFDCADDVSFTVRGGPGEVALWAPRSLGGGYHVLGMTVAASGARYQDGDAVYWSKGELAMFEYAGRTFVDCRSNPSKVPWADAARRGVTFRALGQEPSWNLEIGAQNLTLITDLGQRRTELTYSSPEVVGQKTTYRTTGGGHDLLVVIDRIACADSMSGEAFEASVTVTFDSALFYGCGRFL